MGSSLAALMAGNRPATRPTASSIAVEVSTAKVEMPK